MHKKYKKYSVEDFVKDENFILWVKYGDQPLTELFDQVKTNYTYQKEAISQARVIVTKLSQKTEYENQASDISEIWNNITNEMESHHHTQNHTVGWRSILSAASVILLLGFGVWFFKTSQPKTKYATQTASLPYQLQEESSIEEVPKKIILPDGSEVTLDANSKISFSPDFNGSAREVYLSGSAFFNVVKNPEKPFLVYANEVITRVVGTSFKISAFESEKNVVVSVKTGKVSVQSNQSQPASNPQEVSLLPNQQAIFSREEMRFTKQDINYSTVVKTETVASISKFSNTPIPIILQSLENQFQIKIIYDQAVFSNCRLTTSFQNETLKEKLEIICEAIGATYEITKIEVSINGNGCN
ncbi:uncharacterized protein DUF4974 [Dyadobacter jejuensis]|uniref:Uncharacterized protein DUF4974 n=1 Tax=Dyadobacter jejuensis TaxID=1082580 RepID=A0A316API0_9BACT|nr:FecR family protein [Dyadobacter jejuensis]PWJ59695.1 uncharacterized protein DUF4974 [Dyadobacter jejuensis]